MNRSNYYISLDIRDSHGACQLDMKQADTHRRLYITLTDGGIPYALTPDSNCVFTAKKPDGTVIFNLCKVENNTVIYDITPQTTAATGLLQCELRLYDADSDDAQLLTSASFSIRVHPTVYTEKDIPASEAEVSALTELITDAAAVSREARAAADAAAEIAQQLESARDDGEFNGIPATHSWNGTVLTVTSASGKSSADLKGEKGDTGATGADGHTPVRGVDYWTEEDKAKLVAEIMDTALGGIEVALDGRSLTAGCLAVNSDDGEVRETYGGVDADNDGSVANVLLLDGSLVNADVNTVIMRNVSPGVEDTDAVNKGQLDAALGDIEAALDGIIAIQDSLIGGGEL